MRTTILTLAMALSAAAQTLPPPNYCFGLLEAVKDRPELPAAELERIQAGHLAHLNQLAQKHWLVGGGPILDGGSLRGLLISKCKSVDEAQQFAAEDPAVENGRLTSRTFGWNGPEAIGDRYWEQKAKNPQSEDRMEHYPVIFLLHTDKPLALTPELSKEHLGSIRALLKEGKMLAAGPFHNAGEYIGVFVFAPMPKEEAEKLVGNDPMVRGGMAKMASYTWMAADGTFKSEPGETHQ